MLRLAILLGVPVPVLAAAADDASTEAWLAYGAFLVLVVVLIARQRRKERRDGR